MTAPSNTTGTMPDVVRSVFDQNALFAYRANNVHRMFATLKRSMDQEPQRGTQVFFTLINALAPATTPLPEATEPAPVALGDTQPSVTLEEYGNVTKSTKKLRLSSLIGLDMAAIREITSNMEESMDLVARAKLIAGTNVKRPGNKAKANLLATDVLTSRLIREVVAKVRGKNTPPPARAGGLLYGGIMHGDVAVDVQEETGQAAWSSPHTYGGDTGPLYTGEIQTFAGVDWIINANAKMDADAGNGGTVDVYHTLVIGEQFLGEAWAEQQHVIVGPVTDDLLRFQPVGWYAFEGFGIIRQDSGYRLETASSIGAN
jgi:N4-gp56 family major capsid protein